MKHLVITNYPMVKIIDDKKRMDGRILALRYPYVIFTDLNKYVEPYNGIDWWRFNHYYCFIDIIDATANLIHVEGDSKEFTEYCRPRNIEILNEVREIPDTRYPHISYKLKYFRISRLTCQDNCAALDAIYNRHMNSCVGMFGTLSLPNPVKPLNEIHYDIEPAIKFYQTGVWKD